MRRILVYNIVPDTDIDFDAVMQQGEDPDDGLLKGNLAAVVLGVDANRELIATALEAIVEDLRKYTLPVLYSVADKAEMARTIKTRPRAR
jgi:hypothetical protein